MSMTELIQPEGTPQLCVVQLHRDLERIATYGPINVLDAKAWCDSHTEKLIPLVKLEMLVKGTDVQPEYHYEVIPLIDKNICHLDESSWAIPEQPLTLDVVLYN